MFKRSDVKDIYPLSPMQQGMLFHSLLEQESTAYFEQAAFTISGRLELELLKQSFSTIIKRYDVLRTVFVYDKVKQPLQVVLKEREADISFFDITGLSDEEKAQYIEDFTRQDKIRSFKLDKDMLMRVALIKLNESSYKVIWSFHHIIMDGWCLAILLKDFFEAYKSLDSGLKVREEHVYPYNSFIKWLEGRDKETALSYWEQYLAGFEQPTGLPTLKGKSKADGYCEVNYSLGTELTKAMQELSQNTGVTLNTMFQAAWALLLSRYNGSDDIIFGAVVSGRPAELPGIDIMIGLFINTVPVRVRIKNEGFSELLRRIQKDSAEMRQYEYFPLADIQGLSEAREKLFDHIIAFENFPVEKGISSNAAEGFSAGDFSMFEQTNYGLTVIIEPGNDLRLRFKFDTALYSKLLIERMVGHLKEIIGQVIAQPQIKLNEIEILTKDEIAELLYTFNNTGAYYPREKTIHQLFEEQAAKTPKKVAVSYKGREMTYNELNIRSNKLAQELRQRSVGPDCIVGIMVERSIEMTVGFLGILKAGGAYLPIDYDYPVERIEYMLEDSGAKLLLVQKDLTNTTSFDGEVLAIDVEEELTDNRDNPSLINTYKDMAYVMYTSGSTGKPKGVAVEHRNVVRLIKNANYIKFSDNDRILQTGAVVFDACTFEIWGALLNGLSLYLADKEDILDGYKLEEELKKNNITILWLTSSLFNQLAQQNIEIFSGLRYLLVGGDVLSPRYINEVRNRYKALTVINGYGPTENTTFSTCFAIDKDYHDSIPIGKPISNSSAYVVDKHNKLQPVGVPGELCVGGDGLARGYLNLPELTKERFIDNPFVAGEKMYRTGDLVRWLTDGNIEFLGRLDHQVKIRGFRIELGEIENQLLSFEEIKEAVVLAYEDENIGKYLCAYFSSDKPIETVELKAHISKELPDYMIPAHLIQLPKLPLNANGKVDRKQLPKPDGSVNIRTAYEAPGSHLEEKLCELWQEILGVERVGVNHDFFELGGHSLKGVNLTARIHKDLGFEVPLREIFKRPTVRQIAELIEGKTQAKFSSIEPAEKADSYILSSAQLRMYTLQQFDESSIGYNIPYALRLHGELDIKRLRQVFEELIKRHEALRTSFEMLDGKPVQIIHDSVDFSLSERSCREAELETCLRGFIKSFDLGMAPLFRAEILRLEDIADEYMLLLDVHHIISDGTSMGILVKEFVQLYEGQGLPELSLQYKDYAVWQNKMLQKEAMKKQEQYWLEQFSDEIPVLNLPADFVRPAVQSFEGEKFSLSLDKELTDGLKSIAKETGTTLYMVFMTALNIVLSRYSGQEDIVIGSPVAGRPHAELQSIMGMFVNTLAMRNKPEGKKTIREFLAEVKENALRAFENQDYQFEELVEKLNVPRNMSRSPLFDVMLIVQNMDMGEFKLRNLSVKPHNYDIKTSKFDITFSAAEVEDSIGMVIEYCTRLFKKETVEILTGHLVNVLKGITNNLDISINDIDLLSEEDKQQLIYDFNSKRASYPRDMTIHQLLEDQTKKTPDSTAVVFGDKQLTYSQLNERANQLARALILNGAEPGSIVGILMERSIDMIVGIMAVLKAGAAYLPIDTAYPSERIEFLLQDSNAKVLLTQSKYISMVEHSAIINIEDESIYPQYCCNLPHGSYPNSLAYIIYTSGSTGKPKGVMVEHSSLMNTLYALQDMYPLQREDAFLFKTTYTFDVSVAEIFGWIMDGGRLVILEQGSEKEPLDIYRAIRDNKITHVNFVPSMFNAFISMIDKAEWDKMSSLKYVMIAGEAISAELAAKIKLLPTNTSFENLYGPTEATIYATGYSLKEYTDSINVSIGNPFTNTRAYVLDRKLRLQPVGVHGELCLAGKGLAKGYLNRAELTEEKFVADPFYAGEKMYKTGDLVRWLPDGNIEFLGRLDHQVKIRGFRIELGEIENQLLSYIGIREAVVAAYKDEVGVYYLCAYFSGEGSIDPTELRMHIGRELPDYMIPAYFMQLSELPLNSNGKVDRKQLPKPDGKTAIGAAYEAPASQFEEELCKLWQEVLGLEKVGVNHNFFEIGGHSLKGVNLVARLHKEFGIEISLREIFKYPTVRQMSNYIMSLNQSKYEEIEAAPEREYYEASPAQKRIYTLQRLEPESTGYNMPGVYELEGRLDLERLKAAFERLIERHEALRTSFEVEDMGLVQRISKECELKLLYKEVSDLQLDKLAKEFIKPFDLSKAPLLRVGLVKVQSESADGVDKHILIFDMHHIISDGVSMEILTQEFLKLYTGEELEPLRIQYKDFSEWQYKLFKDERIKQQEEYWLSKFSEEVTALNLPYDFERPEMQSFDGDRISFELDKGMVERLRQIAREAGSTMYMVLLTAFNILLSKYSGQSDIVVGSPVAGRHHADLSGVIGMFVNTLALRNRIDGRKTFREFLLEVKDNSLSAFENQDYQFEELVEKLNLTRDFSRNPLFDVMFTLQKSSAGEVKAKDLAVKPCNLDGNISKFDITLGAVESSEALSISINYCTSLFKREAIERLGVHFENILMKAAEDADVRISGINMITENEKHQIEFLGRIDSEVKKRGSKIERTAVKEVAASAEATAENEMHINELEAILLGMWKEILGIERVGITSNFFELGGHSLKAINLAAKIYKSLKLEFPIREMFKRPTIKQMAEFIKEQQSLIRSLDFSSIETAEKAESYPLSSSQLRIYTLQSMQGSSIVYNIPYAMRVEGKLDIKRLKQAFEELIKRHEALRTSFKLLDGKPAQVIHDSVDFSLSERSCSEAELETRVRNFIKPFDLSMAPLFRAELISLTAAADEYMLLLDVHHTISDGTSMGILVKEFVQLYEGQRLPELGLQYKDYAVWQNKMLQKEAMKKQEQFWLEQFNDKIPVLNLPADFARPTVQSLEGEKFSLSLDKELTDGLKSIAKETGTTLYMVFMTALNIVLSRYSGQEDIVIGSPVAGRPHAELQSIMGMFVNTLAMRNKPEGKKTIREFLAEVKENALRAFENQDYQFEELVEKLNVPRNMSRNPLFDVMLIIQNMDKGDTKLDGISIKPYDFESGIAKFDMTVIVEEADNSIQMAVEYCTSLFKRESIERLTEHLKNVLCDISMSLDTRICDIDLLSTEEKYKLLEDFNNTYKAYQYDKTICQQFEEQVEKAPNNIAVVSQGNRLTYRQLNDRANQLARELIKMGIEAGNIVGIMVEPSLEMLVGIMAILKAGAAYLPIDTAYPVDRIEYMLTDSRAEVVLTQKNLLSKLDFEGMLLAINEAAIYLGESSNLAPKAQPADLAYIIYTSGSTGKPKGVMVEHRALVNLCEWDKEYYEVTEKDRATKYAGFSFDASVWEIFPYLTSGAALYIVPEEIKLDTIKLNRFFEENQISIGFLPTQICEQFMRLDNKSLKVLQTGGDKLKYFEKRGYKLVNNYGPTENTVAATCFEVDGEYDNIPIGKPNGNIKIYIVDKHNSLQPIGAPGELCISGKSLARGYLNKPELTAEKFVDNPFREGERMYRTGDLARWLPDGNIEFLGRLDYQVKIRGFRIELGEIESRLLSYYGVKEAVVIDREGNDGNKYLCGYITAAKTIDLEALKRHLAEELPEYMIPAYIKQLDAIPMTQNGKVDRRALPESASIVTEKEYVAPESETEEKLCQLWKEVLGIEQVGINDSFFELGGHSLKATTLAAKIHKVFNVEVPLKNLFMNPTIKATAEYIKEAEKNTYMSINPLEKRDYYPLSSAQARIYTLHSLVRNNTSYNIPSVFVINGALDVQRLKDAFKALVNRHEAFRTYFTIAEGELVQKISDSIGFRVEEITLKSADGKEEVEGFIKPFDLGIAPLVRAGIAKLDEQRHLLLIDMHHIISDGFSVGILIKEFKELYEGNKLPELRLQYKDYAVWQRELSSKETVKSLEEYWISSLSNAPMLNMPLDYERPMLQSFEGDAVDLEIDIELTFRLKEISKASGVTMYMLLLAAYNVLLYKYSGQEDIVVGSPVAGRINADLHNVIGMFVNTIALRNYPRGSMDFRAFLEEVKESSIKAFQNQSYQLEELVERLGVSRAVNRNPLFDVVFTVQSMASEEINVSKLQVEPYTFERKISKFDMTLAAVETESNIHIHLEYCTKLYRRETMESLIKHYEAILYALAADMDLRLADIELQNAVGLAEESSFEDVDFSF